jgi:hypothetical protein
MTHQEKAFPFPLFSAKRRPKAAVQAFKDSRNKKSVFLADSRTMGDSSHETESALDCLARAFYFSPLI